MAYISRKIKMTYKNKLKAVILLAAATLVAAFAVGGLLSGGAYADTKNLYADSYRNQLAYSAAEGWNNDPNGLLYVNGVYHMYYQYTWDGSKTQTYWDHMSWGHATSTDLVHWQEQPVAIPAYQTGDDGNYYAMMFSGSAVYDEYNTSGLFNTDSSGKVLAGQGIVAILTQPLDEAGGQRQILAYSKDGGQSFSISREIIAASADGGLGDGEFRDPKVFWNERLGKWLMAVGGGSVRMYSSDNLFDWQYLGETGFSGECPDISRFVVNGEEKYVLIISPEDKAKSHEYNGTNRADTYYPAEYYVVGDLDKNGLFVSSDSVHRLSEGIDCYAFQSFNNAPDGKVYGVSWAASWKTVGEYESIRATYNGGMTVVCELNLVEKDGEYVLTRTPVDGYTQLRTTALKKFSGTLRAGENALDGASADVADIEAELDFSDSTATYAQLNLRVSNEERIVIKYDKTSQTLTLDRSQSSLLAEDLTYYAVEYSRIVQLKDNKLTLRILLDRAFISVFANDGEASFFSVVFPSAISKSMRLVSDGNLSVDAAVYAVEGIFGEVRTNDELILTTDKIDTVVGATNAVIASSYAGGFDYSNVKFTIEEGASFIRLTNLGGTAYITALAKGYARVRVSYGGLSKTIDIYIYNNGFNSDVEYTTRVGGFSYLREDGLFFAVGTSDAFYFSKMYGESIIYSATFTKSTAESQAGGLVFGVSDNLSSYFVATVDFKDNKVKLWQAGIGDLQTADYDFNRYDSVKLTLCVSGERAEIYVNNDVSAAVVYTIDGYGGGGVGLNVYNAEMLINDVVFIDVNAGDGLYYFGDSEVTKVVNVTDGSYRLQSSEYTLTDGYLTFSAQYLETLEAGREYTFRVVTKQGDFDVTVKTDFTSAALIADSEAYQRGDDIALSLSEVVDVYKIELDGKECDFSLSGNIIYLSSEVTAQLISGEHTLTAYTSQGRPTVQITINGLSDSIWTEIEEISYVFFFIDMSIFGALILAYVVFIIIKKVRITKN